MTEDQWRSLAGPLGADADDPWAAFPSDSPEGGLCRQATKRLLRPEVERQDPVEVPTDFGRQHRGRSDPTGIRALLSRRRTGCTVGRGTNRVGSPDVASSTNLGGWINRIGIWNLARPDGLVRGRQGDRAALAGVPRGQHIELGIAEVNLVGLLSELGTTWSRYGCQLLPIGTVYDPFVGRALEPWSFGIYAGGQSILVGTPSGVTLAPEGGAHQSVITPSIGLEQARVHRLGAGLRTGPRVDTAFGHLEAGS